MAARDQINIQISVAHKKFMDDYATDSGLEKTGKLARMIVEQWIEAQMAAGVRPKGVAPNRVAIPGVPARKVASR